MKILFIVDSIFPTTDPTAKIVKRLSENCFNENDDINILSKLNTSKNGKIKNINYHYIQNYDNFNGNIIKKSCVFILKAIKKVFKTSLLNKSIDKKLFYRKITELDKYKEFDRIVAFSGNFAIQKAVSKYCKKTAKKYIAFYTDPFTGNPTNKLALNRSIRTEKKWLNQCSKVLMPSNYKTHYDKYFPSLKTIFHEIELPCYDNQMTEVNIDNNLLIHSGGLGYYFRPITLLYKISDALSSTNYSILNFSVPPKKHDFKKYNNIDFKVLDGESYRNVFDSAFCYILIDNMVGFQIPSKTFEYITTSKKVIYIYADENSETYNFLSRYNNILKIKESEISREIIINYLQEKDICDRTLPKEYKLEYIYALFRNYLFND